jgi:ankyrin repeat protein
MSNEHIAALVLGGKNDDLRAALSRGGFDVNAPRPNSGNGGQGTDGKSALHHAVEQENFQAIQLLLQHPEINPNVQITNTTTNSARTALHNAAGWHMPGEAVPMTQMLLCHKKTDPNVPDADGKTAMIHSAFYGKHEAIRQLMRHKDIDLNHADSAGRGVVGTASAWLKPEATAALMHYALPPKENAAPRTRRVGARREWWRVNKTQQ